MLFDDVARRAPGVRGSPINKLASLLNLLVISTAADELRLSLNSGRNILRLVECTIILVSVVASDPVAATEAFSRRRHIDMLSALTLLVLVIVRIAIDECGRELLLA